MARRAEGGLIDATPASHGGARTPFAKSHDAPGIETLVPPSERKRIGKPLRRQHPFGLYVLDFYCERARLAVEVDGLAHEFGEGPKRDAVRDRWVAQRGVRTVRFSATEVLTNIDGVVREIEAICNERPLRPSGPLPPEGEE